MTCYPRWLPLAAATLLAFAPPHGASAADNPASVPDFRWNLSELYASQAAWDDEFARIKTAAEALDGYKGSLGGSATSMLAALDAGSAVKRASRRLYTYASLQNDEDERISATHERLQQARTLRTLIGERTAWIAPEILQIGAETVHRFEAENPQLRQRFDFFLRDTLRAAPHTLGDEAEGVLASAGSILRQPGSIQEELSSSELPYPTIALSDGTKIRLDEPAYEKYRQSNNREDRKLVFDAFWATWRNYQRTTGDVLATQIMGDTFSAKSRKFSGSLEAALFSDAIPEAVYRTLIAETHTALPTLHRYQRLRQRLLGIEGPLQYYDNYAPLFVLTPQPRFSVADAERITLAALQPLGNDYLSLLRRGFSGQWMDAYPRIGKYAGGYMNGGAYDVHPYLLFNFNDDYYSMSTLAHEWGHAVHTLLADRTQPYETSGYSIFVAETASIGNEMLLIDYMTEHAKSNTEKLFYLGEALEAIRTTFFRQVLFAEFEADIHQKVEQGRPLSGGRLTDMYCGLLKKYYGSDEGDMQVDPAYCIEWAFVPHFYSHFYVYQYGTSIAAAALMTDAILKEGAPARARFLNMLSAGGSDYPYQLLKRAGVDLATPAPYRALVARMNRIMDQIEALESHTRIAFN
jgi:oligoendopeptidase F